MAGTGAHHVLAWLCANDVGRYDKKEDPDALLGKSYNSPVCTVDLFIENQQISSSRKRTSSSRYAAKYVLLHLQAPATDAD